MNENWIVEAVVAKYHIDDNELVYRVQATISPETDRASQTESSGERLKRRIDFNVIKCGKPTSKYSVEPGI